MAPISSKRSEEEGISKKGRTRATHLTYMQTYPKSTCQDAQQKREEPSLLIAPLSKNGGYLLSHLRSTIGAVGLNFSVRNGKRWNPDTITT